jgi:acyl carrier protein
MAAELTARQARALLEDALLDVVPDAPVADLDDAEDLRRALELDSLDMVEVVERLSAKSGVRIEEEDYPELRTLGGAVQFLCRRAGPGS